MPDPQRDPLFADAHVGTVDGLGHFVDADALKRYAAAYRTAATHLPPSVVRTLETRSGPVRAHEFAPATVTDHVPLVLVAGRNAATPSWAPALPALLALGHPVVAVDSPGEAGCSVQTAPFDEPADQATWVAEAVRALGHEQVHLIGHSLGGWVAAQVAQHRPDVLATVTVLDPPSVFTRLSPRFVLAGLVSVLLPVPALRRRLLGWIAGGSTDVAPVPAATDLEALGLMGLATFRVRQPPPARPDPADLRPRGVPSLAVLGGRSRVHDARVAARVALEAGWAAEVWPVAGHTLHVDFPERLAAQLSVHLERSR